jgi:hypothetical protein
LSAVTVALMINLGTSTKQQSIQKRNHARLCLPAQCLDGPALRVALGLYGTVCTLTVHTGKQTRVPTAVYVVPTRALQQDTQQLVAVVATQQLVAVVATQRHSVTINLYAYAA